MFKDMLCYKPGPAEKSHWENIMRLVDSAGDACFYRDHFTPGHITASGLLISADGKRVLMNHHKFLNIWICFGGHADGERDTANVAMREVVEESGIYDIERIGGVFDVDVHDIPFNTKKNEPEHKHFDIRYLFRVKDSASEAFKASDESTALRWCTYDEARSLADPDDSMTRMLIKWFAIEKLAPLYEPKEKKTV